jgi:hypothetical protein
LGTSVWARFGRTDPWLGELTGKAPSPADRVAAFMDGETSVEGVPVMVHRVAPNRRERPRFTRIKTQVVTREGRERRDRLYGPPS